MAQTKRKENRGGARPNSGPKRQTLSVRQLKEFERAAKAKQKETGMSLQDIVLQIAYDESAPRRDRLAASKLFWDKSVIVAHEGGEADKQAGLHIYLPEHVKEDNVVPIDK
jgi:hypothetical protein